MRLDLEPDPAYRAKAWAVSMVLVLMALVIVGIVWAFAMTYLRPVIGFGAVVVVAAVAGALSFGIGRVIAWLARG